VLDGKADYWINAMEGLYRSHLDLMSVVKGEGDVTRPMAQNVEVQNLNDVEQKVDIVPFEEKGDSLNFNLFKRFDIFQNGNETDVVEVQHGDSTTEYNVVDVGPTNLAVPEDASILVLAELYKYLAVHATFKKRCTRLLERLTRMADGWMSDRGFDNSLKLKYISGTVMAAFVGSEHELRAVQWGARNAARIVGTMNNLHNEDRLGVKRTFISSLLGGDFYAWLKSTQLNLSGN
jgi:hypothetical protein